MFTTGFINAKSRMDVFMILGISMNLEQQEGWEEKAKYNWCV